MDGAIRKIMALLLAFAIVVTLTPLLDPAYAIDEDPGLVEGVEIREGGSERFKVKADVAEPDELFDGFLTMKAAGSRTKKTAGSRLKGANKAIYDYLNKEIAKIAEGKRDNAFFEMTAEEVLGENNHWCAADLGLKRLTDTSGDLSETASYYLQNFDMVLNALMADNPYALYWFDKESWVSSYGFDYTIEVDGEGVEWVYLFNDAFCEMHAGAAYSASGGADSPYTDVAIGRSAAQTASRAQAIVDKYNGYEDVARLRGYANEICGLVSYNTAAAGGSTDDGNPWELIWVFDEDESTNVVCEGYAKAFKFLCDLTEFETGVDCITVTGDLDGGGHMWNIVTLGDGLNYLVDVTNSDGGRSMRDDYLFLCKSPSDSEYPVYRFKVTGGTYKYTYDNMSIQTFSRNELMIPGDGSGHTPIDDPIDEPGDIDSFEAELGNLMFYEGFGGHWEYPEGGGNAYYHYDIYYNDVYAKGNKVIINGTTYTCNGNEFVSGDGSVLAGEVRLTEYQSENNQWSVENPGHAAIEYEEGRCIVEVPIVKSPVKEFRIEFKEDQVLYAGRDSYEAMSWLYDEETGDYSEVTWDCFWYAESRVRNCFDGDVLVLDGVRYTCHIDASKNIGYFKSANGKKIPEEAIFMESGQSAENPWGPGEHEVTTYYYINGKPAAEFKSKVRVYANPVDSIRFVPSSAFRVLKENDDFYFMYVPGDKYIVNYNDGRGEVAYTARWVPAADGDGYELYFRDANGKDPKEGKMYVQPLYSKMNSNWKAGEHTYYVTYFNRSYEFKAKLITRWQDQPRVTQTMKDLPAVTILKAVPGKKSLTVKWKKVSKAKQKKFKSIQVQYSTDKKFKKNVKSVYVKKSAVSRKISKLKSKKRYYVRIRAYWKDGDIIHISNWSKVKNCKAK